MGPLTSPALVAEHSRVLSSSMITVITSTSTAAKGILSTSSVALCREAGTPRKNTEREHAIQEQQFFGLRQSFVCSAVHSAYRDPLSTYRYTDGKFVCVQNGCLFANIQDDKEKTHKDNTARLQAM